jgi:hypothetical protein
MRRVLLAVALLVLGAACGGEKRDWEGAWLDARGEPVRGPVVWTYRGSEHCDDESAVFLHLGWPLGTAESIGSGRQYIRDPEGLFAEAVVVPLDLDATLPAKAKYTGYHFEDVELWISKSEAAEAVYVVLGEHVERWPRTTYVLACA